MTEPTPPPVVLIVDDEPANIDLLRDLLRDHYRIKAATSGERALVIAGKPTPPDVILLDAMMPGLDGYAVCQRLRDNPATARIPVIFISALADPAAQRRALELGARAFLAKPVHGDQLRESVRLALADWST